MPTNKPTHDDNCNIDYDLDVAIVVSNGCDLSDDDCNTLREFIRDLIEKTSNPDYVTMTLITHNMGGITTVTGDCDSTLNVVDGLTYSNAGDATDYDGALAKAYEVLEGQSGDEQKIVMVSFCNPDGGDDTCNSPASNNADGDIETNVVNVATHLDNFLV